MSTHEFDTEQEMDDWADRFEDLCFEHLSLKEEVKDKREELKYAEKDLLDFETDYPNIP